MAGKVMKAKALTSYGRLVLATNRESYSGPASRSSKFVLRVSLLSL